MIGGGHRFVWDLDKTYLQTEFETVRGLLRAAFESPEDKRAYPGAATVLRALKRRSGQRLNILSGSPRQMRRKLQDKLALDGVAWDRFHLKPNLRNILQGRLSEVREQVGYKLGCLLRWRKEEGALPETLVGDDCEADAFVYSLYADLTAGRVGGSELDAVLDATGCHPVTRQSVFDALDGVVLGDRVRRILIHLDRRTDPGALDVYGPRLVPVYNYFQVVAILWADERLDRRALVDVAAELAVSAGYGAGALLHALEDLVRRGHLRVEQAEEAGTSIAPILGPRRSADLGIRLAAADRERSTPGTRGAGARIDYVALRARGRRG